MKTLLKLIFLGVLTVLLSMAATAKTVEKDPPAAKTESVFVLKAHKKFVGGVVSVLRKNGTVVAEHTLNKRKLVIDFAGMKSGDYTIRLVKGEQTKELAFSKK